MPIQFPRPSGPARSYIDQQWMKLGQKMFAVVPAPSMQQPGLPYDMTGYKQRRYAVNLRRLNTMYQAPDQLSRDNPAKPVFSVSMDKTLGSNRVQGRLNLAISGVSRDSTGAALGGCTIKVFRTADDILVASTVSDGSGSWTAYPNQVGPYYFVEYKAGSPDVFGTSPNTNTAVAVVP